MIARTSIARIEVLQEILARSLGNPDIHVQPYREGVDSWVDLVRCADGALAVVRSAKVERRMTRYEGLVDYGGVLEKEAVVSRLLCEARVPTPRVLRWQRTHASEHELSWMLLEFVPHDSVDALSKECQRELGGIARRIHTIEPRGRDLDLLFTSGVAWSDWIRQRILMRIAAAGRYMPVPDPVDSERMLNAALAMRRNHPTTLLHLDLRPPNLGVKDNGIVSVFDLANAIVGDPYLELARVRGCGLLTPEFVEGYGEDHSRLQSNQRVLDAYELDLTALLVVVSREEIDDDDLHRQMVARTAELFQHLESEAAR